MVTFVRLDFVMDSCVLLERRFLSEALFAQFAAKMKLVTYGKPMVGASLLADQQY